MTKRLLVVDDDADMRLTLKLALELAGYAVDVAGNAARRSSCSAGSPPTCSSPTSSCPTPTASRRSTRFAGIPGDQDRGGFGRRPVLQRNYLPDAELIGVEGTLQKPFDVDALLGLLDRL